MQLRDEHEYIEDTYLDLTLVHHFNAPCSLLP